jgi:hypothetical protein
MLGAWHKHGRERVDEEIPDELIAKVIARVVNIQKQFAHELSGVRTERRADVKTALSELVAEYLEK